MNYESRQSVVRVYFAALLLVIACGSPDVLAAAPAVESSPNIVMIMADDLGYGELGCYGQKLIKTPRLDALAAEGMRFTQFYAGSPVCASSRCVLMTGKHTGHAAIRDNGDPKLTPELRQSKEKYGWEFPGQNPLPPEEVTIAELLKQRGYATAATGKWGLGHFGTTGDPNAQGFDLFYGFNCQRHAHNHYPKFLWQNAEKQILPGNDRTARGETYSQDKFTEVALDFMREHHDQPFFLYVPYAIPHLAIQVPDESLKQYEGVIVEEGYKHRGYIPHPKPRAGYAAMVSHMDRDIGKIVDLLEELGLTDNTLVIFMSDNGPTYDRLGGSDSDYFNSADGLRGFKGSVYEGGLRVPMIARWKGKIPAGVKTPIVSASWDLLPTLCETVGAEAPAEIDGISLLPELTGKGRQEEHQSLIWEFPGYGGQQAIRFGDWKAVRTKLKKGNREFELYDLATDRAEENNLADGRPEIVKRAAALLESGRTDSELFNVFGRRKK